VKIICILLSSVAAFATCAQTYAGTLYGATASGSPGQLYVLNQANGSVVQNVGPLNDVTGLNYPITALAFHPTSGVLYGATGNNPAATAGRFVTINPATAQVTVVSPFNAGPANDEGTPATMADLAFDSAGNLFGLASIGGPQLYSINIATGQATVIGNSGLASTSGGGLAISPGGVYYGTPTASRYGTYDSTTGVFTNITNPTKPGGGGSYAALDFDGGVLYGLNSAPGSPPPTFLATIDPTTGAVTNVGQSVTALDAIAFQPGIVPEPSAAALVLGSLLFCVMARVRRS
jgi:hypothetical protein